MNKSLLAAGGVILILVVIGVIFWTKQSTQQTITPAEIPSKQADTSQSPGEFSFASPKKSAHYETNIPAHGTVLAGVPINVVIDFNFDLASLSVIKIEKDGEEYGAGETVIDKNKLSMRRDMDASAPDGVYTVNYNACWPDGSCHDGHFQFAIDRNKAESYQDLTAKKEVTVKLSQIQFYPRDIKVSKATKVIWVNDDDAVHYVNTDSHPAHTYYLAQNSKALGRGESFSLTFDKAGIYLYHCSAHASSMVGSILVE